MLRNGAFSEAWRTIEADVGWLKNQEPGGWQLSILRPGDPLYDDPNTTVTGIPECVHKLNNQLPAIEQLGGPAALILTGTAVYEIFNSSAVFGAALSQTVTDLAPGTSGRLIVPIQAHLHGETDPFGAESGVWVNGEGGWVNGFDMGDRVWHRHEIEFMVPENGRVEVVIRVKSKWPRPKDFFIDDVVLTAVAGNGGDEGEAPAQPPEQVVRIRVPDGFEVQERKNTSGQLVIVRVPPGVTVIVE